MLTQINISTIWKNHLNLGNKFPNPTVKLTPHLILDDAIFSTLSDLGRTECPSLYIGQFHEWIGQCP